MPRNKKVEDVPVDDVALTLSARLADIKTTLARCETQIAELGGIIGRLSADTELLNWLQRYCADRFWVWTGSDLLSYAKHARPNKGIVSYDLRTIIRQAKEAAGE
jgi:hypothetical protein